VVEFVEVAEVCIVALEPATIRPICARSAR
jgi:hypothetical protein